MESYEKTNTFWNILKGVVISVIFTVICLFVFSCLLVFTNVSENIMQPTVIVITGVSILLGSSIGNRKSKKNGILNGGIVGFIYILCIYIISSITGESFALNLQAGIMMIVGIIAGMVGGVIGVNV